MMLTSRSVLSSIAIAVCLAAAVFAAAREEFHVGAADSYAAHQASENVVAGAKVLSDPDDIAAAFGKKISFRQYGITPVLIVLQNNRKGAVDLRSIEVSLVAEDGRHVSALRPNEIAYRAGGKPPKGNDIPSPIPLPRHKSNITSSEITAHAFSADMLAPGDTASGFFYFSATPEPGDKIYINGLQDARTGHDIMYHEFDLMGLAAK